MATSDNINVDLTPLLGVLNSINKSMSNQTGVLSNLYKITVDSKKDQARYAAMNKPGSNIIDSVGKLASGLGSSVSGGGAGLGNILSGLGGGLGSALSGAGMGIGAGGLGIGALLAGGGYFLKALQDFDGEKVKDNIVELLSISEEFDSGMLEFFGKGGAFALAMTGMGIGLAAFGVGSAAAGLSDALSNYFSIPDWAKGVKDNVLTLLSIADGVSGNVEFFLESATFFPAMAGLALGLAAFGIGGGIAGIGEALARFSGGEEWAQNTKNNVLTLLSISDSLGGKLEAFGETGTFLTIMTGIGTGLALFGTGSAAVGISELINDEDWAQKIKDDVGILMSIEDSLGGKLAAFGEAGTFFTAMTGIGTGLAVFGTGSTITGLSALINDEDWALKIKEDVLGLLSIADSIPSDDTFTEGSGKFFLAMSGIAAGLGVFAAGQFVGTLGNAITSVLSFFTGAENPFDQLMKLADNADELMLGAQALEKITNALDSFAGIEIKSINIDFKQLATDLGQAIPFLDALANGGEVKGSAGWFGLGSNINFEKGLLDPTLRLDEMAEAVSKVRYTLGQATSYPVTTPQPEAQITVPAVPKETSGYNVNSTVNNVGGSTVNNNSTKNTTINTFSNPSSALSPYAQFQPFTSH